MSRTNVENIYPLSPMQQGMLFEALAATEPGVNFVQIVWTLRGGLDAPAFLRAWQEVVDRHAILRTSFAWERLPRPMQVVRARAALPVVEQDLRALSAEEQAREVERFTRSDRELGFELTKAPLMRVALLRLTDDAYRFVWSRHHLLLDGWSTPLVVKEVFAIYEARRRGEEPQLDRPRPFGEYIGWLVKQDAARLEAFWRGRLADFSAPTALRVDHAPAGEARHDDRKLLLSEDLSGKLQAFARRHQLTLSTLVQGAWSLVLARYSGEEDVLFGVTVSGRSAPVAGIDRMVGMFINTVPVRVQVAPDEPALSWLKRLHQDQLDLRDHEHAPLVDVQGWSGVPRGTPLFESLVVYENYPVEDALRQGSGGLEVADSRTIERSSLPLMLVAQLRRALSLHLAHDASRFDADVVERMLGHLATLLEGLAADPEARLGDLPILPEAERARVVTEWNRTAAPYREGRTTPELFEDHVAATPDAVALVFGREEVTFRELDRRANQLAHRLRRLGVGPGVRVGISVHRSPAMWVGVLAAMKAGGAYVPLDATYPRDRLAFMIEDAALAVLLTEERVAAELPPHQVQTILLDADWPSIAAEPEGKPVVAISLEDAAYVIYTSGSTGRPKGVIIPHRGLASVAEVHRRAFGCGPDLRVLQFSSFSFDAAVWELAMSLLNGGALVLAPQESLIGPELIELIEQQRVNGALLPPSLLATLPDAALPGFRCLISGGEACTAELAARWAPGRTMWNAYGPTEITIFATLGPITAEGGRPRLGPPIANARVYVLDARLRPLPIGVPGELCLAGIGLASGYLNRPELTAEKFVVDPFVPGEKMYRTGDLGRWLPDGTLDYLGRIDHQVKVRGFRIELGEIESALLAHPSVREAVVIAREDAPGDKRLAAYLVAADEQAIPAIAELRSFLAASLPEFMIPSAFVTLERMPRTPNGKLDRRALPAPETFGALAAADRAFVAPRGPVEEEVARIFAEVLRLPADHIGAHDGFFELGGHSLHATQVVARLRAALGLTLPIRSLFEARTVAALARQIDAALHAGQVAAAPPLSRSAREGGLPLSFAQERIWFTDQLAPGDPSYVVSHTLRFEGELDADALERAVQEIMRRHEVLRTTYASVGGRPVQVIHADAGTSLPVTRWPELGAGGREEAGRREMAEELRRPFDLAAGPVTRVRLFELGEHDHVLFWTMHHMVADAWTKGVLNREIGALYQAFRGGGTASPLPELPIQYADYAAWQRAWLSGAVMDEMLAYWKKHLEGAPQLIELPTDRPRPSVQSPRGEWRAILVRDEVTRALKDLSHREGATLFMTLLAAFDVLLHRYTGQGDVVVGTPIASRTHAQTEDLIGFFVNTLVLRVQLAPETTFRELLGRVREACLGAYAHQEMPFERLVQEIAPARDLSRTPLFQVMFSLQNTPRDEASPAGPARRSVSVENHSTKFDITLAMSEGPRGLAAVLEYKTDLFDRATIDRMLAHYAMLLEGIAKAPQRPVSALPMLTAEERERLLVGWNDTAAAVPEGRTIHDLFEEQVDRSPEAPAVLFGEAALTYRELDERGNRLAHHLRLLGVGPGVLVAVAMPRSLDAVIAIVGVLKAGGAYVPIDPAYPPDRIAVMLEDARAPVLLTQERLADELPVQSATLVCLDAEWDMIAAQPAERPASLASPTDAAYVIYTSGSTGRPKGVVVTHSNLVASTAARLRRYAAPIERFLVVSPFAFDSSVAGIFWTLCQGGAVVLPPDSFQEDPSLLGAIIAARRVSHILCVPSLYAFLLSSAAPGHLDALRVVIVAGEAAPPELVARHHARHPGVALFNEYGPTEATVWASVYETRPGEAGTRVPIGKPIPNAQIYILDARMEPVPIGVVGELYVGGAGVSRGYLNRPELTEARFVADPFARGPAAAGARLYRTGDRARWLPTGDVDFLGRDDDQVKVRGYRIELGEIEAAIGRHPEVEEVVVIAREDTPGDKRLVAYVVLAAEAEASGADLQRGIAATLPDYMVPRIWVKLAALPLSPNGKVDRKALPSPEPGATEGAFVPPRGPIEEGVARIWAAVLDLPRVGVHDDFFALGGHSLLATQTVGRIAAAFEVELPLHSLFEAPTVAGLAGLIAAAIREGRGVEIPPLVSGSRDGGIPLSFAQERLWLVAQLDPGDTSYLVPLVIRVKGALDVGALSRAIAAVVARHEVLRTTFATVDGRAVQIVHEEMPVPFVVERLEAAPEEREAAARRAAAEEASRPLDLAAGPIVRARVLELAAEDHVLLLTTHHIATDAWSMGIMNREIASLYEALSAGREPSLPGLPLQYADYALWQRGWLRGDVLERHAAYWREQLAGAPQILDLPADRPRPSVRSNRGERRLFAVPPEVAKGLEELAQRESVTLFMTLLAAFEVLLYRYTGQGDLLVGSPIAGRTRAETEGLVGFFLNMLVLRAQVSGEATFREHLQRTKVACLGAYAHQDMPFERLVQDLATDRDPSRTPLFQVIFNLQNAPSESLALVNLRLGGIGVEGAMVKSDLTLIMSEGARGLLGWFNYSTDLFEASTAERMVAHFLALLHGIAADAGQPVGAIPMLSEDERQKLVAWNADAPLPLPAAPPPPVAPVAAPPPDACVHELFQAQAAQTPDAVAVTCGAAQLTYRELDAAANRLSRRLCALGVAPGEKVGVCLGRSVDVIVAILGVLKAGGAYVPLDPGCPSRELAGLVEASGANLILTEDGFAGALPASAELLRLDRDAGSLARLSPARFDGGATSSDVACVLFTPGAASPLEGVSVEHGALVRGLRRAAAGLERVPSWCYEHASALSLDPGSRLFLTLCLGGTVRVVPEERTPPAV